MICNIINIGPVLFENEKDAIVIYGDSVDDYGLQQVYFICRLHRE